MASVFARRRRRDTAMDAASTTWLSIRFASSRRCTQKPSNPASCMTTISTGAPATSSALERMRASRPSNPAPSPADIECFDIVTLPGDSEVTSHVDWLNSSDAYSVETCRSTSANSFMGRGIGFLHVCHHDGPTVPGRDCRRFPWNLYHILSMEPHLSFRVLRVRSSISTIANDSYVCWI